MFDSVFRVITICFAIQVIGSICAQAEVIRDEIRQRLLLHWEALHTVELKGEEYVTDENWLRKPDAPYFKFEFVMGGGGKREFKNILIDAKENKTNIAWYRDDGKLLFSIQSFKNHIDVIDTVTVTKTSNTPDSFNTSMNAYLWQWLPRGHRMVDVIEPGAKISKKRNSKWGEVIVVETMLDSYPIKLELSEKHDYLPVKISFNNMSDQEVEKFENIKGLWLPVKGHILAKSPDGSLMHRGFVANVIKINDPIFQERFQMPTLEPGSLIINRTSKGSSGIYSKVKATESELHEFRNALESKYGDIKNDALVQPVIAMREPDPSSWPNRLLVLSILLLGLVVVQRVRAFRALTRS